MNMLLAALEKHLDAVKHFLIQDTLKTRQKMAIVVPFASLVVPAAFIWFVKA